jgi:mRNA-degrading endonuclease RelE of RelBE toxin-antitoxin system
VRYQLIVAASADRQIAKLPRRIAEAVVAFMTGPLLDNPRRVGKPLLPPLDGLWSARRGDYRILYEIDADTVNVVRVGHRGDIYRFRR